MNSKIKYWVELSEYDLETAKAMLQSKRYLYVGFMSHQAIKKLNRTDKEQVMATELEQCEEYAKKLPLQERALLIKRLIEGLDELDEQNLERLWVQEAARRFKEFKAGNIKAQSAENVFRNVRTKLQDL